MVPIQTINGNQKIAYRCSNATIAFAGSAGIFEKLHINQS